MKEINAAQKAMELAEEALEKVFGAIATQMCGNINSMLEIEAAKVTAANKTPEQLEKEAAEEAAKTLKAYANDGNMKFAAGILREIEERTAAKILTALEDPILVTQLLDEIKNTKHFNAPK